MTDSMRPPAAPRPPAARPTPGPHPGDDRSLGDLFSELTSETTTLVRQEIALAKTEIKADAKKAGASAGAAVSGGLVAYAGLIVLLVGLGWGLNSLIGSTWLGLVIVGLAVAGLGYVMLQKGLATLKTIDPTPERTIQTLKEDKEWLTNQTP